MELMDIQRVEATDSTHYFPNYEQGPLYLSVALAGEVGETCNEVKKYARGDFDWEELQAKLEGELPDILIYLVMLSDQMGINLEKAYEAKKEYNEQRYRGIDPTGFRHPITGE